MAGRRSLAVIAGCALAASGLAWAVAPGGAAGVGAQAPQEFEFTGEPQSYAVPEGVCQVDVDVVGAGGGDGYYTGKSGLNVSSGGTPSSGVPGKGARVQATLAVTPGETLHVYVGGVGADGDVVVGPPEDTASATGGAGGWNGGAVGGSFAIDGVIEVDDPYYAGAAAAGGGGGGASDIRRGGTADSDRVVVAGGGGGSGANGISAEAPSETSGLNQRDGGSGGNANGGNGGDGEAATNGGTGGGRPGAAGSAGSGGGSSNDDPDVLSVVVSAGGGGGGGLKGGNGGTAANNVDGVLSGGGGGGGAGSGLAPLAATVTNAFATDNGYVIITPAEPGVGCAPVLQVAKVVSGSAPAGFTVRVQCTAAEITEVGAAAATKTVVDVNLPYGADGSPTASGAPAGWVVDTSVWEYSDAVLTGATCTATETATAGAETVSYACAWSTVPLWVPDDSGCPGVSSGPSAAPQSVYLSATGQTGVLTVTNTFAPTPAEVSPNFTG